MKRLNKCTKRFATRAMAVGLITIMLINMAMPSNLVVHASEKAISDSEKITFEDEVTINGISIKASAVEGVVPKDAKLYARKITNEKMTNTCNTLLTQEIERKRSWESREKTVNGTIIFDIKLLDKEGNELQPNKKKGDVKITFTMESLVEESETDITKTLAAFTLDEEAVGVTEIESKIDAEKGTVTIQKEESSLYGVAIASVEPLKNDMGTMVIKKGSETGPIVADLVASDTPELIPGDEYYLCVTLDVPEKASGVKNFVKIVLGEEAEDGSYKANGLVATNIPGNTELPGEILHDGFSHLLDRIECPDIQYGSNAKEDGTANTHVLKDGVFLYQISDKKLSGDPIYFAMGIKLDSVYWSNVERIKEAIHLGMGTIDPSGNETYPYEYASDISVGKENKKEFYYSSNQKSVGMQIGKFTSPISISLKSDKNAPMLYQEVSYDVTYPAEAEVRVSLSSSNMDTMVNTLTGTLSISEKTMNSDGTATQTVVLRNGYKGLDSRTIAYIFLKFPEGKFQEDDVKEISLTNAKLKFAGNEEGEESLGSDITVVYKPTSDKVGQVTMSANNRTTNTTTGMGNVYNWNIGREPGEMVETTSLLGSCNIKNSGTTATNNEKTYIAYFNTTNAQAVINFVTIPVGWRAKENDYKSELLVHWTGRDAKGNEVTGETTVQSVKYRCKNTSTKKGGPYIILKAADLGIVSFTNVRADIGRLWDGFTTCSSAGSNRFNSQTSAAYGYFTSSNVGDVVVNTYELINTDDDADVNDLSCTSKAESTNDATIYMNNSVAITETDSKIVAGDSVTIKDWTLDPYYVVTSGTSQKPGTNASMILDPVVILKLPKGITYSDLSFKKKTYAFYGSTSTNGTPTVSDVPEYDIENITYMNTTGDGTNLYKITFDKMILGSFDENGAHSTLLMDITFNTDRLVTTTTYDFGDLVHLTSKDYITTTNYTSLNFSYAVPDNYHVNNGNDLSSGRAVNAAITGIAVQRLSEITVSSSISASEIDGKEVPLEERQWLTYDEGNPNSVVFLGLKSSGQYRVVINNPSTAVGNDFTLFIPIPKRNEDLGEMLQETKNGFDMSLSIADLPEGFTAEYVTMEKLNGMNMDDVKYQTAEESKANAMMITAKEIGSGKYYELLFDFSINSDASSVDVGLTNIFRSAFQYTLEGMVKNAVGSYVAAEIASSTIEGTVFEDANLNGLLDLGMEGGIAGITVTAKDTKGRVQIAETDMYGRYEMFQVREEKIILTMKVPENQHYRFSLDARAEIPAGSIGTMVTPAKGNQSATYIIPKASKQEIVNACISQIQTVTYDRGSGAGQAPIPKEYRRGDTVTVVAPSDGMYKNGYQFLGWSKAGPSAKTVDYIPGQSFLMDLDITLYAVWEAKELTITFDYNGGTASDPGFTTKTVIYGKQYKQKDEDGRVFPENPTKDGWSFWKWELVTSDAEGIGVAITGDSKVSITENMTLRAVYTTLNKSSDTITTMCGVTFTEGSPLYDLNEMIRAVNDDEPSLTNKIEYSLVAGELPVGLSFSADHSKIYGTPLEMTGMDKEILIGVKTRNGITHLFGLTIKVKPIPVTMIVSASPKASVTLDDGKAEVTLIASISGLDARYPLMGQVAFDIMDASNVSNSLGSVHLLPDGTASISWTAIKSGVYDINALLTGTSSTVYQIEMVENVEGYVVADAPLVNHLIKFDVSCADATLSTTQKYAVEGAKYGNLPIPVRAGFEFAGWYTDPQEGSKVTKGCIVSLGKTEGTQILYAHWSEKSYTVIYETNTSDAVNSMTVSYQQGMLLPSNDLDKKGYSFKEWILKGSETVVTNADTYRQLVENDGVKSVTLVAVWSPNTYNVLYDGNGGSVNARSIRVTYGSSYGKLIMPLRTGYEFLGWKDQNGSIVTDASIFKFAGETTLTAQWKVKELYSVIYDTKGGSLVAGMDKVAWNAGNLGTGKEPVRKGYRFVGWKHGSAMVTDATTYGMLAVMETVTMITLVAQWEAVAVQVSFDLNPPAGVSTDALIHPQTVYYEKEYNTLPEPELQGYLFDGWYTGAKDGTRVTPATLVTKVEGHVLYARWKKEFYSVSYPTTMTGYHINPIEGQQSGIKEHGRYSFQILIEDGYDKTDLFKVKVKAAGEDDRTAVEVPCIDGIYTLDDIQDDLVLITYGIDDITAPTLSIMVGENRWDKFVSMVTFGLYSNKKQDVTIQAEDIGSKLAEVSYHISNVPLNKEQISLNSVPWTAYEDVVTIAPEQECYVYAKAVDNRGNITYVNSDGIVLDSVSPVLNGITSGETYYGKMQIEVYESHLDTLVVNGNETLLDKDQRFTLLPSEDPYVITVSDKVGNTAEYQIMVKKATPTVRPVFTIPDPLLVGASLSTVGIACSKGDTKGMISWSNIQQGLSVGANDYEWVFLPDDVESFTEVRGTKQLLPVTMVEEGSELGPQDDMLIKPPATTKPEVIEPDTMKPDVMEPETVKPETVKPEVAKPEVVTPTKEQALSGNVVITIKEDEDDRKVATQFVDRDQVIDACLSQEEKQKVQNGANAEIKLEIKMVTDAVAISDQEQIDTGITEFGAQKGETVIDAYVELQLWKSINAGDWIRVSETEKDVTVKMEIPARLQTKGAEYLIIKSSKNGYVIEEDQDELEETITISTRYFSTCAIAHTAPQEIGDMVGTHEEEQTVAPQKLSNRISWKRTAFWGGLLAMVAYVLYLRYRGKKKNETED